MGMERNTQRKISKDCIISNFFFISCNYSNVYSFWNIYKECTKQTEDIYGYFDHILYHAEQNTDNLSFSQKKISKKYQPYVKRIGTITLFDYEENQKILFWIC